MICQRCGTCCTFEVLINIGGSAVVKPDGRLCPYLSFDGAVATCAAHDEPWFKGSPCDTYGNSNVDPDFVCKRGRRCGVGEAVIEGGGLLKRNPSLMAIKAEDCEILADWPRP